MATISSPCSVQLTMQQIVSCNRFTCSSMICGGTTVLLELLLPSTLSDLKIGSNGGIEFVSSLDRLLFYFTKFSSCFRIV